VDLFYFQGKIVECVHCGCRGCSGWRTDGLDSVDDRVLTMQKLTLLHIRTDVNMWSCSYCLC